MEAVDVRYCSCCGWPVHYCKYRKPSKQAELGCEAALKREDEALWALVYPRLDGDDVDENASDQVEKENSNHCSESEDCEEGEESEEEDEKGNSASCFAFDKAKVPPFGVPIKPHVKRQEGYVPVLQIRFATRGNNKGVTQVFNYEDFSIEPKEIMMTLRKALACAVSETVLDQLGGDIITVQGKYTKEVAAIFTAAGVPKENIFHATTGKNTKRKRR